MVSYKTLNKTALDYDPQQLRRQRLLFEGGTNLLKIDNLSIFIKLNAKEGKLSYLERLGLASYDNSLAEITNSIVSQLCAQTLSVVPTSFLNTKKHDENALYFKLADNADQKGQNLNEVIKCLITSAQTHQFAYLGVDFPSIKPSSQADVSDHIPYFYSIEPECMINYQYDELGKLKWCVLKDISQPQPSPYSERDLTLYQFKIWEINEGMVTVSTYELTKDIREPAQDDDELVLITSILTEFKEIPIFKFTLPSAMYIFGLIGEQCANLLIKTTDLNYALHKSCFPTLVIQYGAEYPSNGDIGEVQSDISRISNAETQYADQNIIPLGGIDKYGFAEPHGHSYQIQLEVIKSQNDRLHQITHKMAQSISKNKGQAQSGQSQVESKKDIEIVLNSLGEIVKSFVKKLFTFISNHTDQTQYVVLGMDNYRSIDRAEVIDEASKIDLINIPSRTHKLLTAVRLSQELNYDASEADKLKVRQELEEAYQNMSPEEIKYGNQIILNPPNAQALTQQGAEKEE